LSLGIFEEIERLIEYIPLDAKSLIDGKFANGVSIDSHYFFHDTDGVATRLGVIEPGINSVSFRDIVKLLNKFLKDAKIEELVVAQGISAKQIVRGNGRVDNAHGYYQNMQFPSQSIIFDFCLAALDGDVFDAKLYLTRSFHLLGLRRRMALLLSVIVNEFELRLDKDIRKLLTLIAMISEPGNIDVYFDVKNEGFNSRYATYLKEMQMVHLVSI
jgi:hypothetical protein